MRTSTYLPSSLLLEFFFRILFCYDGKLHENGKLAQHKCYAHKCTYIHRQLNIRVQFAVIN